MGAMLKAARAFTGRPKIAKVEGAYHGLYDYAEVSQTSEARKLGRGAAPGERACCARNPGGHVLARGCHRDSLQRPERALAILDRAQVGAMPAVCSISCRTALASIPRTSEPSSHSFATWTETRKRFVLLRSR